MAQQQPLISQPSPPSTFTPSFDRLVNLGLNTCAGISVAGYGFASFPDVLVTPETIFYCASTTKAFTGAAASLLIDDEKYPEFKWTAPISRLIPDDFVLQDDYWTQHITVQDALSHRTGLPSHDLAYDGHNSTPKDITRALRHLPLTLAPRTEFYYCNIMYVVMCHVIEAVTGTWLGDFFKTHIWTPLKMDSTFFHIRDALVSGKPIAHGYYWSSADKKFAKVPWSPISGDGAGGIFSTTLDYSKWVRSMIEKNGPLSPAGYEAVTSAHMFHVDKLPQHSDLTYGYGWDISWYRGEKIIWHTGGLEGFTSNVVYLPERAWGCVLMSNTDPSTGSPTLDKLKYHLIDELLNVPESECIDWDARNQKSAEEAKEFLTHAQEILYPNAAKLPTSLPMASYTGTYTHPGNGNVTVSVKDDALYIDGRDRTWKFEMDLEHVSGDYFLVKYRFISGGPDQAIKAKFLVDASGVVSRFGCLFEPTMAPDMIWFERVEE